MSQTLLANLARIQPFLICYAVAEAFFILAKRLDITVAIKSAAQRTDAENERIRRGLVRSLILEMLAFVPISTFLTLETVRYILPNQLLASPSTYPMLGLIAYAFPFALLKRVVTALTLAKLKGFYDELSRAERAELEGGTTVPSGDHGA